jgi:hypothetical protein
MRAKGMTTRGEWKWKGACNVLKIGCARVEVRERLVRAGEHERERDDHAWLGGRSLRGVRVTREAGW